MWAEGYASNEFVTLQKRYSCCGYLRFNDFPNIYCPQNVYTPCARRFKEVFAKPLHGCGINSISDGIIRALAIIAFYFSYSEDEDINALDDLNSQM